MPLEKITKGKFEELSGKIGESDWTGLTGDGSGSRFCDTDECEV
jgi:hypothetical protein